MERRRRREPDAAPEMPGAFCGIDPGKKGSACLLVGNDVHFIDWQESETYLAGLMREWHEEFRIQACILEKVHAFPKQGVVGVFTFGCNFGTWRGILAALGIPFTLELPQAWMKSLVGKEGSMPVAARMYPKAQLFGPKGGALDGRSDALCMAVVARRRFLGGES